MISDAWVEHIVTIDILSLWFPPQYCYTILFMYQLAQYHPFYMVLDTFEVTLIYVDVMKALMGSAQGDQVVYDT